MDNACAPIMHLRIINNYVTAAITDWHRNARLSVHMPRQRGSGSGFLTSKYNTTGTGGTIAGTSSFGMSGVNSHVLLSAPSNGWTKTKV